MEDAAKRLASAGFIVTDLDLPAQYSDLVDTREVINDFERARGMLHTNGSATANKLAKAWPKAFGTASQCGASVTLMRLSVSTDVAGCWATSSPRLTCYSTPTAQGEAPVGLRYTGDHRFQSIWNFSRVRRR